MEYEWQTYGFAGSLLPDGGTKLAHFKGTIEEVQRQLDRAAEECGGTAPDLKTMREPNHQIMMEQIACRIFNDTFKDNPQLGDPPGGIRQDAPSPLAAPRNRQ